MKGAQHDALYNDYLRRRYSLDRAEDPLELPLDSIAVRELRKDAAKDGRQLPRWPGVTHVQTTYSQKYQDAAHQVVARWGIARV